MVSHTHHRYIFLWLLKYYWQEYSSHHELFFCDDSVVIYPWKSFHIHKQKVFLLCVFSYDLIDYLLEKTSCCTQNTDEIFLQCVFSSVYTARPKINVPLIHHRIITNIEFYTQLNLCIEKAHIILRFLWKFQMSRFIGFEYTGSFVTVVVFGPFQVWYKEIHTTVWSGYCLWNARWAARRLCVCSYFKTRKALWRAVSCWPTILKSVKSQHDNLTWSWLNLPLN